MPMIYTSLWDTLSRSNSDDFRPLLTYTITMDLMEERITRLEARMDKVEERVDTLDSKMDTLLDSTSQIKAILAENTNVTKSARRNTRGWGFFSILLSLIAKIGEFLLWR